jgi:hypothetical protein
MTREITKKEILDSMKNLPRRNALLRAMYRLCVLDKLAQGIQASDAQKRMSNKKVIEYFEKKFPFS